MLPIKPSSTARTTAIPAPDCEKPISLGNYKEAAVTIQQVVAKQDKLTRNPSTHVAVRSEGQRSGWRIPAVESSSPTTQTEYWANALASLVNADTKEHACSSTSIAS